MNNRIKEFINYITENYRKDEYIILKDKDSSIIDLIVKDENGIAIQRYFYHDELDFDTIINGVIELDFLFKDIIKICKFSNSFT